MKWEMEVISPSSYLPSSNWFLQDSKTRWTPAENKMFENALALHDKDTPERWFLVAQKIPGKTVGDVIRHYRELEVDVSNIEAGLIPIPGYSTASPFTLEWVSSHGFDGFKQPYGLGSRRSSAGRPPEQERKKGIPWTEEEHKLFLMGLKKYGKGDWRNISRNFVVTRTPTQVASHAQKYFIRQLSGGKDKRRASIHDITTVNLTDTATTSPDSKCPPSPDHSTINILSQSPSSTSMPKPSNFVWNQPSSGGTMAFSATHGNENIFVAPAFGFNSYGLRDMQAQNLYRTGNNINGAFMGHHSQNVQLQSMQRYPHG